MTKLCLAPHIRIVVLFFPLGSNSFGVDLSVLSMCNHSIVDYGTFGLWAALMAGGRIILPRGYSTEKSPDMMWWERAAMSNVEYVDIELLNVSLS